MTDQTVPSPSPFRTWGLWAVLTGALALIVVLGQIFAPMSEPAPSVGTQIGEIAGDMKRAAWRSFFGLEQEVAAPVPPSWTDWLPLAGPVIGVLAILLALVSGLRGENWRFAAYGTGLGGSAIVFYYFWWVALLVVGCMLLIAIIENLGDFFSFG